MAEAAVAAVAAITGLTGTAAAVATTAIATVAATSAVAILSTQADAPKSQGQMNNLELASNAPRRLQIGQRGNGGTLIDWYTYGSTNQFVELVIYLGEGPMGNITGVWSSGRKVYTGSIGHGARVQLTEFDSPDARCYVEYYDGRPGQSAPPGLTARLAAGGNDTWPSTNVATGCAYVVVTCRWDPDTMPAIPSFFFETQGAKLYDRRLDSTAGGSGSHRLKDPSTWAVSSNPAVALDHYVLGRYLSSGDSSPVFGIGLDPDTVDYSRFAAMANLCDEAVTVTQTQWYSSTQPRYEANGFIFASDTYKDVILNLCRAMNARAADFGGQIGIIDNEAKSAVMDLTDADVVAGSVETYSPKKSRDDLIGGVRGTYQDPDNNYNPVDYPDVTDDAWALEDGDELEYGEFNLDFEIDPERAQRLAKLHGYRQRRQATLQGFYTMKALALEDGDWFTRTTEKFPSGKTFEIVGSPVLDTATMTIKIDAIEVDTSDSAWNAATDPSPVIAPSPVPSALPPQLGDPQFELTSTTETGDGGTETPMIIVRHLAETATDIYGLEIEVSLNTSVPPAATPSSTIKQFILPPGQEYVNITDLQPSTNYVMRTRPKLGVRTGNWSDWEAITTQSNMTALQVVGQGWGATASEESSGNNYVGVGGNAITDPYFRQFGGGQGVWGVDGPVGVSVSEIRQTPDGLRHYYVESSVPTANYYRRIRLSHTTGKFEGINVQEGDRIGASAMCGLEDGDRAELWIVFRDENGGWVNGYAFTAQSPGLGQGRRETFTYISGIQDAPAGARYAYFEFRFYGNSGTAFKGRLAEPMLCRLSALQAVVPPFMPGGTGSEHGSNITGDHEAAAIAGQGALATLNEVNEGLISVPNLAAISAALGAITGGSLNINNRFVVASDGTVSIISASSGARLSINSSVIEVYDASDTLRVRLGLW